LDSSTRESRNRLSTDIADIFKFETVVPVAFKIAAGKHQDPERSVRIACRDIFRQTKLLSKIIPAIEEILSAGGLTVPEPPEDALPPAIPEPESLGDAGHRC
jgi:CRISPR-associated protein Cas1